MTRGIPNFLESVIKLPDGKCASDTNPDAWFPDIVGKARPSRKRLLPIAQEAKRAIDICNACPTKDKCLEAGMDPLNLSYGIWGGTLPPERHAMAGISFSEGSDVGRAMRTMQGLKPYFNEVGLETNW